MIQQVWANDDGMTIWSNEDLCVHLIYYGETLVGHAVNKNSAIVKAKEFLKTIKSETANSDKEFETMLKWLNKHPDAYKAFLRWQSLRADYLELLFEGKNNLGAAQTTFDRIKRINTELVAAILNEDEVKFWEIYRKEIEH